MAEAEIDIKNEELSNVEIYSTVVDDPPKIAGRYTCTLL